MGGLFVCDGGEIGGGRRDWWLDSGWVESCWYDWEVEGVVEKENEAVMRDKGELGDESRGGDVMVSLSS